VGEEELRRRRRISGERFYLWNEFEWGRKGKS